MLALDNRRATPCEVHDDGKDFVRTNKWIVFGHHFAAIAGPGPLVGPVLAAQFGYLPGALWILIGVVLGGAVQDFVILFCSIRRDVLAEVADVFFQHRLRPAFAALLRHTLIIKRAVQTDAQVGAAFHAGFAATGLAGQRPGIAAVVAMSGHLRFTIYGAPSPKINLVNRKS